jgi:hypothetical protein
MLDTIASAPISCISGCTVLGHSSALLPSFFGCEALISLDGWCWLAVLDAGDWFGGSPI